MRRLSFVVCLLVLVCFMSCSDSKNTEPRPEPIKMQAGSWEEAIELFADAWETMNFELYDSLLTDDYIFYFSDEDVAQDPQIPPSWTLQQELTAVGGLFDDPNVERIELEWLPGDLEDPDSVSSDGKVLVSNIYLEIDIRSPDDGELWTNIIQGFAEFELRKMSYTTAEGDTVWKFVLWKDLTAVAPKTPIGVTQSTTWGQIKVQ